MDWLKIGVYFVGIIVIISVLLFATYVSLDSRNLIPTKITLFYSKTCPHCIAIKKDWERFENWANSFIWLSVSKIDINDPENASLVKSYNVKGVPTIIKEKLLYRTTFEGERSFIKLLEFARGYSYDRRALLT